MHFLSLIAFDIILIFVRLQYGKAMSNDWNNLSDERILILNDIGKSFESQVVGYHPCEMYHSYICSGLNDSDDYGSETMVTADVKSLVDEHILDAKISTLSQIELKARSFMRACLDQNDDMKLHENLKELDIFEYDKTWPFGDNWNEETFNWISMAAKFQSFGKSLIVDVSTGTYEDRNVLLIRPKLLTEFNEALFQSDFSEFFGNKSDEVKLSNQIVRNNFTNVKKNYNQTTTKQLFTFESLKEAFPDFHLSHYFYILLNGRNLADDTMILVTNKSEIMKLIDVINGMEEKDVANTFLYELLIGFNADDMYLSECYQSFQNNFKDVLALITIRHFVNENDANSQKELFEQFLLSLNKKAPIRLLRRKAVANAREELRNFQKIAKNQDTFQYVVSDYLNDDYKNLRIDYRNNLQNQINLGRFQMKRGQFSNFYSNFDSRESNENPYVDFFNLHFQTFYRLHNKPMAFYFAILGEYFWESVIRVGIDTNLLEKCHFEVTHQSTKKHNMPIENLIKFGASRMAYDDLRQWQRKNFNLSRAEDEILLNHNYNGKKLFFHIYMQKRCKTFISYDYAFIGHSRDFSKEYKCDPGSRMSYTDKCTAWEGTQ